MKCEPSASYNNKSKNKKIEKQCLKLLNQAIDTKAEKSNQLNESGLATIKVNYIGRLYVLMALSNFFSIFLGWTTWFSVLSFDVRVSLFLIQENDAPIEDNCTCAVAIPFYLRAHP